MTWFNRESIVRAWQGRTLLTETTTKTETTKMTTTATKTTTANVDAYGSRVGTQCATINSVLLASRKALSVAEIAEKTGLPNKRVRNHLEYLSRKGHINY